MLQHPKLLLMVKYTWLLFDVVIKLMTLHLHKSGALATSHARASRFNAEFTNRLRSLLGYMNNLHLKRSLTV